VEQRGFKTDGHRERALELAAASYWQPRKASVRMLRLTIGDATADMAGKGWRSLDGEEVPCQHERM
jgi:hypothetical protein